jgi:hypothetical protein
LLPGRMPLGFDSPVGGFFDRVALVVDLAFFGATSGNCAPTVAMGSAVAAVAGSESLTQFSYASECSHFTSTQIPFSIISFA